MEDLRDGQLVKVRRMQGHQHPVYVEKHRAIEIGDEFVQIGWSGYYHQLRSEGSIEVESCR